MIEIKNQIDRNTYNPSEWVRKYLSRIPRGKPVLDLACGGGRHVRLLLDEGFSVVAIDKDVRKLDDLLDTPNLKIIKFNLEIGDKIPFSNNEFAGIIVVNYLHRPLFPYLASALTNGGVLIYQTFMVGNEAYGSPSNPDFLLAENELDKVFKKKLNVLAFEQGYRDDPKPAVIQSICAVKR